MKRFVWPVVVGAVAAALAALIAPWPTRLDGRTTGDPALAARVRALAGDARGFQGLSVALVEGARLRFAGLGSSGDPERPRVDASTMFEIGSITKALTGMLLAQLIRDGRVRSDSTLRELLPDVTFGDRNMADVTVAELASHRSGLPRILWGWRTPAMLARQLRGGDPYAGQTIDGVFAAASDSSPDDDRGQVSYSNFGFALLGHALAEKVGVPYVRLMRERILVPLGMTDTGFHLDGAPPPPYAATGHSAAGRQLGAWGSSAYAPAGAGAWSSAADLAKLVAAALAGTAPGIEAVQPRHAAGEDRRIGYGWFTERVEGREITWHNGGTGGHRSFVAYDRAAGLGVVVLGNTDRAVDPIGFALLGVRDDPAGRHSARIPMIASLLGAFGGALGLLYAALARGRWSPKRDRLRLVSNAGWAVVGPAIAHRVGLWYAVPPWVWMAAVGLAAAALLVAAAEWPRLPVCAGRFAWLRWTTTALSTSLAIAVGLLTLA